MWSLKEACLLKLSEPEGGLQSIVVTMQPTKLPFHTPRVPCDPNATWDLVRVHFNTCTDRISWNITAQPLTNTQFFANNNDNKTTGKMRVKQKEIAFAEIVYFAGPAGWANYALTQTLEYQSIMSIEQFGETRLSDMPCLVSQSRVIGRTGFGLELHLVSKDHSSSIQESCVLFSVG